MSAPRACAAGAGWYARRGTPDGRRAVDREGLEAMLAAYLAAWRRGDAAGCAAFYAEDARMEDPLLPEPIAGRDRIGEYFTRGFAERPADTTRRILGVAAGEDRVFFEWVIESARGASRGVSVWEVADQRVKRDRSYWHSCGGPGAAAPRRGPDPREEPR